MHVLLLDREDEDNIFFSKVGCISLHGSVSQKIELFVVIAA
jgi:hypothetical protein